MSSSTVGVVIPHWFTDKSTEACLLSVLASRDVTMAVYVYDNGSSPVSRKRLADLFPTVCWMGDGNNIGFACAVNKAARKALDDGNDAIVVLNNDAVVEPHTLAQLLSTPGDIVNPTILSIPDRERVWFNGGKLSFSGKGIHKDIGTLLRDVPVRLPVEEISFATACAVLIRKEVFEQIGFFDEGYYAYSEDLDFALRARHAGLSVRINRNARAYHAQSQSVKANVGKEFRDYYVARNRIRFLKKHFARDWFLVRLIPAVFLASLIPAFAFVCSGQLARSEALVRGLLDGLRGVQGRSFPES